MSALVFRPAIEFDYAFLADAFNRSFEGYAVNFHFDARALEQRARPENWDLSTSFVSLLGDELAGVLFTSRRGRSCRVAAMGVTAAARGRGVGRAKMQHCIDEARARGDTELLLEVIESNTPARRLYEFVGMRSLRRLIGFECVNPPGVTASALEEIDIAEFAAVAHAEYAPAMPWQMRPETLANLTPPFRAFTLERRAFALIGDPSLPRVSIRGLAVRAGDQRQRLGTALLQAIFAEFPQKTWAVTPILPAGLADGFFRSNEFVESAIAQHEMILPLA